MRLQPILIRRLALLLVFVALRVEALDARKPLAEFMHRTWSVDNGLPQSTIRDITQTPDGYMWFATHEGVARFDGLTFTVFNEANAPALRGSGVAALLAARDGSLWLGLRDGGVARYRAGKYGNGTFEVINPKGGLPAGTVSYLSQDAAGDIWIGTSANGLAHMVDNETRIYTHDNGLPSDIISAIRPLASGEVWVGTAAGLTLFRDGKPLPAPTGSWLDGASISAILQDSQKRLWIATRGQGMAVGDPSGNGTFRRYQRRDGLVNDAVTKLHQDRHGGLWIGTIEGMQRLVGDQFETFTALDGLTNNHVRHIYEDAEGNIWAGTDHGIDRFRDSLITTWGLRRGLAEEFARAVLEDGKGRIWIATSDGLFCLAANGVRRYGRENGLLNGAVLALAEDGDGTIWIGTNGGGLHRMRGERIELVSSQLGLSSASVRAIVPARDGTLWIGTHGGLVKWNWRSGGEVKRYGVADGLPSEQVNALLEDGKGRLWVGARGGLAWLAQGKLAAVNVESKPLPSVLAINADSEGRLWLSTVNGMALVREDSRGAGADARLISSADGLPGQTYFAALDDVRGHLWMCSNRGIVRVDKAQLDELLAGTRRAVEPMHYGRPEGMATAQCNGSSQPAGWRTRDGRMLFATAKGVVVADPGRPAANNLRPPPVHVKEVMVDAEPAILSVDGNGILVPAGRHRLEISYVGLSLADPEKVRYRYLLEGFDRGWVEAGRESKAVYTNLVPGAYRFRVVASNNDGVWNTEGATLTVEQAEPFHQALWFRILVSLAAILAGLGLYRARVARLHAQGERLQRMVDDRTRDLELEKQKLELAGNERARLLLQVAESAKAYEKLSKEDSLTGLGNRRELDRFLASAFERAVRNRRPLSVAIADLDHFKKINDQFSHAIGDDVLRQVAQILVHGCRAADMVGRYGGEEFVLVLPDSSAEDARLICERLRTAVESHRWSSDYPGLVVTMSFGIASLTDEVSFERLLARADARLYEAKESGRNQVRG